jgi:hypothetical protein
VKEIYAEVRGLGGEVLAVSFAPPARLAAYVARFPLPFPVAADPERHAYRALGLQHASWTGMFRPRVLGRYLGLMFRGWLPWKADRGADLLQLGGDFVLDAERRVIFAYRSAAPTDRPTGRQLLDAVRAATGR